MSLEENKAIVRRFIEEFNKRNLAILDELIAPDYVAIPEKFEVGKLTSTTANKPWLSY